jgi:hypothetical protein
MTFHSRLPLAIVAVCLAACASSPPAASTGSASTAPAGTASSRQIYLALLRTPVTPSSLPAGFRGDGPPRPGDPNDNDRAHHVIGEVDIPLRGPDAADQIEMIVFPTATDASADIAGGLHQNPADHVVTSTQPGPGFTVPARIYNVHVFVPGSKAGTKAFSHCVATVGNVLVVGSAGRGGNQSSGNPVNACALTHVAIRHLAAVDNRNALPVPSPT